MLRNPSKIRLGIRLTISIVKRNTWRLSIKPRAPFIIVVITPAAFSLLRAYQRADKTYRMLETQARATRDALHERGTHPRETIVVAR